ncbi:MAG: permease prefix domain 2-containing transporter, partial [Bacteroidota bacterium]
MKPIPPHIALKFLRWFCREDYLDEVEGDLLEIYERQASENRKKAKRMLWWNILKHLRRDYFKTIHTRQNSITMFNYNFKLAIRSFQRHRSQFAINLIGLTTGLTCAFFIYLWVQDEYSIDKFHENDDQLYQVMKMEVYNNEKTISPATPGLLGESLQADFP